MDKLKPIEHKFKAFFFSIFRKTLKKGKENFVPLDGTKIKKVLFLRPEKIGDMVISFPVFDGLVKHFPNIKISILGSPKNYAIIKNDPRFEKIFLYTKNLWKDIKTIRAMRNENYDCVVDMICDDSVTALFLSQILSRGKPRIGVGKIKYQEYYDFNYDHRMGNTGHIIENTLKLLDAFNIDSATIDGFAPPFIDDDSSNKAREFIETVKNGSDSSLLIGYNLSAGAPTRVWEMSKSVELVKSLIALNRNIKMILFTIPTERKRAEEVKSQINNSVYLIPDQMNLIQASAVIKNLNLLISPDTSLVHIARSFKVNVVGLYTQFMKNFLLWRPYKQSVGEVVSNNDDNIHDITPDDVVKTFQKLAIEQKLLELK